MSEFSSQLELLMELVDSEIKNSFPQTEPSNLYEPIRYLLGGKGKRLRPVLAILSAGIVGGNPVDALKPAVAFELLHNFTLIHDDIMDKSPTRRGRETIHNKWNESIGILSGDLLLALSYKKIIDALPANLNKEILRTFTDAFIEVCEGQGFDIDFEKRKEISEDEYFKMIDKKTAKLIEKAMFAGGQIGNAKIEQLKILSEIGLYLGLGFQLQDDLLDLTAKSDKFGKEIGKDIKEGKKTYIMIMAKKLFDKPDDCVLINKFYDDDGLDGEDIQKMIKTLQINGIFDLVQSRIDSYFAQINKKLDFFPDNDSRRMLQEIINFTFKREY